MKLGCSSTKIIPNKLPVLYNLLGQAFNNEKALVRSRGLLQGLWYFAKSWWQHFVCSNACAIELEDTVVVTGGGNHYAIATVQIYNISGPQEQLPDMLMARLRHACAHYVDSQNRVVSIILMLYWWQFIVYVVSMTAYVNVYIIHVQLQSFLYNL